MHQHGHARKILIYQLDGKVPNIAVMRIAAHHRASGDQVEFRWTGNPRRELRDRPFLPEHDIQDHEGLALRG
jgi:hypothetical protein